MSDLFLGNNQNDDEKSSIASGVEPSRRKSSTNISTWGQVGYLTTFEEDALEKMRDLFPRHDDAELLRFLRARQFSMKKASQLFQNYLVWHEKDKPWQQDLEYIRPMFDSGEQYLYGMDKQGRPTVYFRCGLHAKNDGDRSIAAIKWCVETMISRMADKHSTYNVVMDFKGFGWSNFDLQWAQKIAPIVGDCYPERVGLIIVVNTNWTTRKAWDLVKRLLDKRTRSKFYWLSNNAAKRSEQMKEFYDVDQLPTELGGAATFNMSEWCDYLAMELQRKKTRMQDLSKEEFSELVSDAPIVKAASSARGKGSGSFDKGVALFSGTGHDAALKNRSRQRGLAALFSCTKKTAVAEDAVVRVSN